ncbi:MAG: LamG domain-containing protein [Bacteroidetes bacterium]|nr:LamG domain-containing protein [Bacteroidota bacterium]MCW5895853.1 LamG domain-containing protein [Bacteroidota bacterium]
MKREVMFSLFFVLFFSLACNDSGTMPDLSNQNQPAGNMVLRFASPPPGITTVVATLSRAGYADRTLSMAISDSSATGSFDDVPVGRWHLRIDAKDTSGIVRYSGETDVDVYPGATSSIALQLMPTTGRIVIVVTWGTPTQDPSLLLYYPFNGNANDESGNNHHGVVNNATLVADRFGNPNRAYSFNGFSAYIDAGRDTALNPRNALTISVWIKYNGGFDYRHIVTRWDVVDGVDGRTYAVGIHPTNRLRFTISRDGTDAGAVSILDAASLSVAGSWIHVAATWDGLTMRLYKNGEQVATGFANSIARSPNTRTAISGILGRLNDPPSHMFNGAIDDVRLYSRALSQQEIQTLYSDM